MFGAGIVLTLASAPQRIGTFATVALMIAGQLIAGALIDAFGWLGNERIPVTASRIIGLALLTAGAALTLNVDLGRVTQPSPGSCRPHRAPVN